MHVEQPIVVSVNISEGGIPKKPIEIGRLEVGGLVGDEHDHEKHSSPQQAICLIDAEDLDDLRAEGFDVSPGATGENLTCRGLNADDLNIGDRLRFSGGVEVEITKVRQPCYVLDAIDPTLKKSIIGRCGIYAKVIEPGEIRTGESIELFSLRLAGEQDDSTESVH